LEEVRLGEKRRVPKRQRRGEEEENEFQMC